MSKKLRKKDIKRIAKAMTRDLMADAFSVGGGGGRSSPYVAAAGGRRTLSWTPPNFGPTTSATASFERLLTRSRDAVRNNEWVGGLIDYASSEAIGVGIKPKSLAPEEKQREAIQELWNRSVDEMDYDGVLDFYGLQELVYREFYEAGEVFPRIRHMGPNSGLQVPIKIQLLEAEMVPHDYNLNTGSVEGAFTIAGIEFSGGVNRKRLGYWVYSSHPNEQSLLDRIGAKDKVYIPAREMLHVYRPERAGQVRGTPRIARLLSRIHDLEKFDDAMLLRAQVATLFAGILKKPDKNSGSNINPLTGRPFDASLDDDDTALAPIEAGTMMEVPEGYEVDFTNPPDLGRNYESFARYHLMAASSSLGLTYELMTGDLRGISDRALRLLLQKFRRRIEMEQHSIMAFQFCRPIWAAWFDAAMLAGKLSHVIDIKDYVANRALYTAVKWVPHAWPYFHPEQDVKATEMEIRAGLASRADKVSNRGDDIEQIDKQNAEDNARAKKLGLLYTSTTSKEDALVGATTVRTKDGDGDGIVGEGDAPKPKKQADDGEENEEDGQ